MRDREGALHARGLPSVDRVLADPQVRALGGSYHHHVVVAVVRSTLAAWRRNVLAGADLPDFQDLTAEITARIAMWRAGPRPVINATGVIIHTNLGRAPLSEDARRAVVDAFGYCDLEFDLDTGDRGTRSAHVETLLRDLTGAGGAHLTGNNAGAVTLALASLARGREVIVSRGEAVEIGGGFRIPAILRQSGAKLVEVGTTNRTRLDDYREAIGPKTGAVLQVHSSNFRIVGFVERVPLPDLAELARAHEIPLLQDNGSGALLDTAPYGLAHEPTVQDALSAGVDVVMFSGDKLLGGPQAGIVVGREDLIARLRRHPLARAMRADKMTVAALSATLLAYMRGDAEESIPVWRMIAEPVGAITARAERLKGSLEKAGMSVTLTEGESTVGGGSLPGETLPSVLLSLPEGPSASALRAASPPVVARTSRGNVLIDLRTVQPGEDELLQAAIVQAQSGGRGPTTEALPPSREDGRR